MRTNCEGLVLVESCFGIEENRGDFVISSLQVYRIGILAKTYGKQFVDEAVHFPPVAYTFHLQPFHERIVKYAQ